MSAVQSCPMMTAEVQIHNACVCVKLLESTIQESILTRKVNEYLVTTKISSCGSLQNEPINIQQYSVTN
jgi:hypothetical protein